VSTSPVPELGQWVVDRDDEVAVLRYDGGERRTLGIEGAREVGDLIAERSGRPEPPVLVLVVDVLHAELAEVRQMADGRPIADWAPWVRAIDLVERYPSATLVAVERQATCGGLELSLAADIRVASPSARLGVLETRMGILPGAGGTQRLPELIGTGNAALLVLTGASVSGTEAHRMGLVQLVDDDPVARATELAEHLATIGPEVLGAAKGALAAGRVRSPDGFRVEGRAFLSVVGTTSSKRRIDDWLTAQSAGANPALDTSPLP
jgi:enoyl-CoA hydratase/carnithine racemase